jgi:hypothetical protein
MRLIVQTFALGATFALLILMATAMQEDGAKAERIQVQDSGSKIVVPAARPRGVPARTRERASELEKEARAAADPRDRHVEAAPASSGGDAQRSARAQLGPADLELLGPVSRDPPEEFRGTALEWRLRDPVTDEQLAELVKSVPRRSPREQLAVLFYVHHFRPNEALAAPLLAIRKDVSDSPTLLAAWAVAARDVAIHGAPAAKWDAATRTALSPPEGFREHLVVALLEAHTDVLRDYGDVVSPSTWRGMSTNLQKLERAFPGYRTASALRPRVQALGAAIDNALDLLIDPRGAYAGDVEFLRLATVCPGARTHATLLAYLEQWPKTASKIDKGEQALAVALAANAIVAGGSLGERTRLAAWITSCDLSLVPISDAAVRSLKADLRRQPDMPESWKQQLRPEPDEAASDDSSSGGR